MHFAYTSGLYPGIIVPHVYAWDLTFTNPVGAPEVLMDVACGRKLNELSDHPNRLWGLDTTSEEQQLAATKSLATLQATLSVPVSFDKIGSVTRDDEAKFIVGASARHSSTSPRNRILGGLISLSLTSREPDSSRRYCLL